MMYMQPTWLPDPLHGLVSVLDQISNGHFFVDTAWLQLRPTIVFFLGPMKPPRQAHTGDTVLVKSIEMTGRTVERILL
jgi:hypothetical protein